MAVNEDFWYQLQLLTDKVRSEFTQFDHNASITYDNELIKRSVIDKCEKIVGDIVTSIMSEESPVLRVPRPPKGAARASGDSLVGLGTSRNTRRFAIMLNTLAQSYRHVNDGTFATRRDVYYEHLWLYRSQAAVDRSAEDLARMMEVPRHGLHLTITGKGLVAGCLTYTTHDGTIVNVQQAQSGIMVPECVEGLVDVTSDARYILVVEKDATFQKLVEAQIHRSYGPAILITGKGYPDLPTRQFLYRLWTDLKIPVLALTDADPYGLHIAAVYKFGALARDEPGLSVSNLTWLGVLPTDLVALQLPPHGLLPLTPLDHGKLASLAAHPIISTNTQWLQQIKEQKRLGKKAEIQSLAHITQDFLTSVYLPNKLRQGGWVE